MHSSDIKGTDSFNLEFNQGSDANYSGQFAALKSSTKQAPTDLISGSETTVTTNSAPLAVRPGDLNFGSVPVGSTATMPLTYGVGIDANTAQLGVSPRGLVFGNVGINSSTTLPVVLTSTGTGPVRINSAIASGSSYSVSGGIFPTTLNPKQSLTLNIKFAPTAAGATTGALTISSNASRHTTTIVGLSGIGVAAVPQLLVSSGSLSFGNVTAGSSAALPVTLTSTGTGPLKINSAAVSNSGYSISGGTLPATLNPKQTLTLNVKFAPKAAGKLVGTLTINSNALRHTTAMVGLSGTGTAAIPQLQVSTGNVSFGNVNVGSSAMLPLALTSTGTGPVKINSATVGGTGYSVSGGAFPLTLNPKQTLTFQIKFAPAASGTAVGKITISSNSSTGATATVSLTGNGVAATTPQLGVSPGSLSFGDVNVKSSATLPVTLTSSGTGSVKINSATVSGTGYSVSGGTFPVTLSPKQTLTLQVKFAPSASGTLMGKITISSNSSTGSTAIINLSGTATNAQHEVDLSWAAPSNSPVRIAGYNIYRSTGDGTSYQKINLSPESDSDYVDKTVQSGLSYRYIVKSVGADGVESTPSNQISVTIP